MFGRRKESQHPPVPAESKENNFAEVLKTIQNADLDPQKYIVIGGAALTLYGFARRSHDIDLRLHPDLHHEIAEGHIVIPNQQISTYPGLDYSINRRLLGQPKNDSDLLPLDLIQYHPSVVEDQDFETYRYKYANYDNEHNIPIINLEELSSAKRATAKMPALRGPVKAALDAYDIGLMSEYFRNQINK